MDKERFDFLTYEQFKRLSWNEKVAYLERATAELEGCGRLTLARLSNLSPIHSRLSRVDAKGNEEHRLGFDGPSAQLARTGGAPERT